MLVLNSSSITGRGSQQQKILISCQKNDTEARTDLSSLPFVVHLSSYGNLGNMHNPQLLELYIIHNPMIL